jgi:hypothetical protein
MIANAVFKAKTEIENAAYEGLRIGLSTRITNLFVVLSSGGAASNAEENFTNGMRLALKNYKTAQSIISRELENI